MFLTWHHSEHNPLIPGSAGLEVVYQDEASGTGVIYHRASVRGDVIARMNGEFNEFLLP
jgi:hypothetical protein